MDFQLADGRHHCTIISETGPLIGGYLSKLLDNKSIARFLKQRQPDVLAEVETIAQTVSLDQ